MKRIGFFQFLFLLLLAIGAGPASSAVWQWSKTASNNAGADPTINWAEGMSPSSINDSARAQMAREAEWRDDISGVNVTGGSSTAYTLTTQASVGGNGLCSNATSLTDGQMIAFRANATNGVNPTMLVDSCSALAIQSMAGTPVPAGTMIGGTPYRASYNLANTSWVLEAGYGNPYNIPLGGLLPSTLGTVPNSNFILPAGQCISTTTYATYWVALGSPASGGCPGGQFAVIDLRGNVLAALDNLNGTPANRLTSASPGCGTAMTTIGASCTNGKETHLLLTTEMPSHNHGITDPGHTHTYSSAGIVNLSGAGITVNAPGAGSTGSSFTGISINNAGGGGSHSIVQPTIGVAYFLRVL